MVVAAPLTSALLSQRPPSGTVTSTTRRGVVFEAILALGSRQMWGIGQVRSVNIIMLSNCEGSLKYIAIQKHSGEPYTN